MKALLINGSPRNNGNTVDALKQVAAQLEQQGIETTTLWIGVKPQQGCVACGMCRRTGVCVYGGDLYNTVRQHLAEADALIIGSPTYFGGPSGSLCTFLDRLFYSSGQMLQNKVFAALVIARRGGATTAFQRLNMYAMLNNMNIATSHYWNIAYGRDRGEATHDIEGMQTMRTLGDNVARLVKALHDAPIPARTPVTQYNFIRESSDKN